MLTCWANLPQAKAVSNCGKGRGTGVRRGHQPASYFRRQSGGQAAPWALWQLGQAVFGGSRAKSTLLVAGTFLLGCASLYKVWPSGQSRFWNTGIRHLLTNVNGQATATLFLCLFVLLFWQLAGQKFRAGALLWDALVLCFSLLCFAKGPVAGIVAIAAVAAVLWGGLRRGASRGGALLFILLVGGEFLLLYRFYFAAGASTSMVMHWQGQTVVDLSRQFLSSNGAQKHTRVEVGVQTLAQTPPQGDTLQQKMAALVGDLNVCSKKGLAERFDSTIGAATVLMPFGGARQLTPAQLMAAKLPVLDGETDAASGMAGTGQIQK